jgi:ABC-type multidrug transport system permease subunit
MSSLELFITERAIFVRERANGYYRPLAYFVSKTLFDLIPLRIIPPILMGSIAYFMIGLRHHDSVSHFFYFILILTLFNLVSGALCIMIGAIAPSVASGNVIATILILTSSLFSGFLLNKDSIPKYLSWIQYTSFWNYAFESMCINEFHGVTVVINPKGMPRYLADGDFWLNELGMVSILSTI